MNAVMNFVPNLNGLIILTSATLIIAQYLDNKQRETIRNIKVSIQEYKFDGDHDNKFVKKMKELWEKVCNVEPLSTYRHIVAYMTLLFLYGIVHFVFLVIEPDNGWPKYILIVLVLILTITLCLMIYRTYCMRQQLKSITDDVKILKIFKDTLGAVSETKSTN